MVFFVVRLLILQRQKMGYVSSIDAFGSLLSKYLTGISQFLPPVLEISKWSPIQVAGLSFQDLIRLHTVYLSYSCCKHGIFYRGALGSVPSYPTRAKASTWLVFQCCSEVWQYFSIRVAFSAGLLCWQEIQIGYYLQSPKNTATLQSKS